MALFAGLKSRLSGSDGVAKSGGESGARWEQLQRSEHVLLAVTDRNGLIVDANGALCRARGGGEKEVLGTGLPYLLNAENRQEFQARMREVVASGGTASAAGQLLAVLGGGGEVQWLILPQTGGSGEVMGLICLGLILEAKAPVDGTKFQDLRDENELLRGRLVEEEDTAVRLREERDQIEAAHRVIEMELERAARTDEQESRAVDSAPPERSIPGMADDNADLSLGEVERRYITRVLERCEGRVSGAKGAAKVLGLHANTLRSRMEKLGISASTRALPGLNA